MECLGGRQERRGEAREEEAEEAEEGASSEH